MSEVVQVELCRDCKSALNEGARKCTKCGAFQDWHYWIQSSQLLFGLISTLALQLIGPLKYLLYRNKPSVQAEILSRRDRYPRASQAHLVFNSWRSFPDTSRDRAAICRNLLAGSLSDVCWRLPDADFLPEIPRMDSMEICGQPHLRTAFILRVECFGLRFRDFFSAPDLFPGSFIRTASVDRQKIAVSLG